MAILLTYDFRNSSFEHSLYLIAATHADFGFNSHTLSYFLGLSFMCIAL